MANIFEVIRFIDSGYPGLAATELFALLDGKINIEECRVITENIHERYCVYNTFYHIAYEIHKNMKSNYDQNKVIALVSADCGLSMHNSRQCVAHAEFLFKRGVDNETVIRSIEMFVKTLKEVE